MELAERKKLILGAIVDAFIKTGEPVGSKMLAEKTGMGLSSATIRNEMSELVELGLLEQPHTSAGRVPSQAGYRFYVDSLMEKRNLGFEEMEQINRLLSIREGDIESILEKAGRILAEITGCAALSTAPCDKDTVLRKVEFLPAGKRSVLLIMLTDSGLVRSRLCRAGDDISPEMLNFLSRLVDDKITGKPIPTLTGQTLEEMTSQLYEYTCALTPLLKGIFTEVGELLGNEVYVRGEANLLNHPDLDSGSVHDLLKVLERADAIRTLIDGVKQGVEIRIGTENGLQFMRDSSVVAAPYAFHGEIAGTVGIIGPRRMDYGKMVSSLEYFSAVLSKLINNVFGSL